VLDQATLDRLHEERARIVADLLTDPAERPATSGRGIHHTALISSDVRRTVEFYQGVLGFPLTEIFENRDYPGSTHFFFDVGNGNAIAFFDLPGLDLRAYEEVLGGLHHCAVSMTPQSWTAAKDRLDARGVPYDHVSGTSLYLRDPDGVRLELISDPLGEMYGTPVV
jgi:catechol 2,3-dioxygenase-like lactoylglutathione lyase family enzyme